jgi:predicted DNA-binding protein
VPNTSDPVSLRFRPEFHQRLQAAAERVGLPKHTLCQSAVKAVVEAIEECGGKLVLPVEFTTKFVPAQHASGKTARKSRTKV